MPEKEKKEMKWNIIKCLGKIDGKPCKNEYPSQLDPTAENSHDRPRCSICGTRV